LVSEQGYILTNAHVIMPSNPRVTVTASDITVHLGSVKSEGHDAKVVLKSDALDLALLQIPADHYVSAPIGSPAEVPVGTPLYALGFPGTDITVITGQRSAAASASPDVDAAWMQTTLPLNEGNSGGPVFGPLGTVVGIAVAKRKEAQLLSYVIP